MPLHNTAITVGRVEIEPDFHWPELRLVLEVDGPNHLRATRRREDELRDAALRAAGWEVIRAGQHELEALAVRLASRLRRD